MDHSYVNRSLLIEVWVPSCLGNCHECGKYIHISTSLPTCTSVSAGKPKTGISASKSRPGFNFDRYSCISFQVHRDPKVVISLAAFICFFLLTPLKVRRNRYFHFFWNEKPLTYWALLPFFLAWETTVVIFSHTCSTFVLPQLVLSESLIPPMSKGLSLSRGNSWLDFFEHAQFSLSELLALRSVVKIGRRPKHGHHFS